MNIESDSGEVRALAVEDAEADVDNCCCVVRFQYSAAVTRVGSAFRERERERESERERHRQRLRVSECAVAVMQTWKTVVYVCSKMLAGRTLEAHSEREGGRGEREREKEMMQMCLVGTPRGDHSLTRKCYCNNAGAFRED